MTTVSGTRFVEIIKVDVSDVPARWDESGEVVELSENIVLERDLMEPGPTYKTAAYGHKIDSTKYTPYNLTGTTLNPVTYDSVPDNKSRAVFINNDIILDAFDNRNRVILRIVNGSQILPNRASFS